MLTQTSIWTVLDGMTYLYLYTRVSKQWHYNIFFKIMFWAFQDIQQHFWSVSLSPSIVTMKNISKFCQISLEGAQLTPILYIQEMHLLEFQNTLFVGCFGPGNTGSMSLSWALFPKPCLFSIKEFQNIYVGDSRSLLIFFLSLRFLTFIYNSLQQW